MVTLAVIACLTIGVAAGELLAPTAIAIVLALVLAPVTNLLERGQRSRPASRRYWPSAPPSR